MQQDVFENKIKPTLLWAGTIVASIMAIAYIVVVFVLIEGFKVETVLNTSLFSFITAVIGFCIMQMLKIQGQSFAENIPDNKAIAMEYNKYQAKEKKTKSLKQYWVSSIISDVLSRCLTLAIMSVGMVYIMIEGSKDYNLLLLAGVNLLMFAGFGLIGLTKTYDFYNNQYIHYMQEKINERKQIEESLALAKEESDKQGNDSVHDGGRSDLLDTSVDTCITCSDSKSVVLDSGECGDNLLGRTIHSSGSITDSLYTFIKENTSEIEKEEIEGQC